MLHKARVDGKSTWFLEHRIKCHTMAAAPDRQIAPHRGLGQFGTYA